MGTILWKLDPKVGLERDLIKYEECSWLGSRVKSNAEMPKVYMSGCGSRKPLFMHNPLIYC